MQETFVLGPLEAKRGSKETGFLPVGETLAMEVKLPVVLIHGVKNGPVLCVSAGVHGYEYSSIEAVQQLIRLIEPAKLRGTLIVVPVVNMPGFETRGPQGGMSTPFQCPIDAINLNRIFPGNPEGTMSYQITAAFMSKIVSRAQYYIDCHGGDLNEELTSHIAVSKTGDMEKDRLAEEMLVASFDCDFMFTRESSTGSASIDAAARMGIPSLLVEAGGYGRVIEEAVQFIDNGIGNAMKRLKMITGEPTQTKKPRIRQRWLLYVTRGGICYTPALGTRVKKGDKVAEVRSIFGELLETLQSPIDGYICFRRSPIPVSTNDRAIGIIPDEDVAPPKPRPYP
jgi:hypothetical protein